VRRMKEASEHATKHDPMDTDYKSFHSKRRAAEGPRATVLRKLIPRTRSRIMFLVCIGFTLFILALLGLVTGYLFSIGFKSLSWEFFTQLPSGRTDAPGGMRHA